MAQTLYGVNYHLDRIYGSEDPQYLYLAVMTGKPGYLTTGSQLGEPVGNGYERLQIPNDVEYWSGAADGHKGNSKTLVFAKATGTWGRVKYWALCDAATDGNVIVWGYMTPRLIVEDSIIRFGKDQLSINIKR